MEVNLHHHLKLERSGVSGLTDNIHIKRTKKTKFTYTCM